MAKSDKERPASSRSAAAPVPGASPAHLREAERGLRVMLSARFPRRWIDQNARDCLHQAAVEYEEWLESNRPHHAPAGWLAQRAWWRALDLAKHEARRAGPPLDSVIHTAADPEGTPEDRVLAEDRGRRLARALSHVTEKERRLIALVYVEGHSITEAGRLLGWGQASASEHLSAAMDKLKALIGPRDQIAEGTIPFVIGALAARTLGDHGRPVGGIVNRASAMVQDLTDLATRPLAATSRRAAALRSAPLTDPGLAAALGGAGRAAAQCGAVALAVLCAAALTSAVDPQSGLLLHQPETRPGVESQPRRPAPSGLSEAGAPSDAERGPLRAAAERRAEARRSARMERDARAARRRKKARRRERIEQTRQARAKRRRAATEHAAALEEEAAPPVGAGASPVEEAATPAETALPPETEAGPEQVEETFNPFTRP